MYSCDFCKNKELCCQFVSVYGRINGFDTYYTPVFKDDYVEDYGSTYDPFVIVNNENEIVCNCACYSISDEAIVAQSIMTEKLDYQQKCNGVETPFSTPPDNLNNDQKALWLEAYYKALNP